MNYYCTLCSDNAEVIKYQKKRGQKMETLLLILLDWFGGAIVSLILGMILNIVMFLPFGRISDVPVN